MFQEQLCLRLDESLQANGVQAALNEVALDTPTDSPAAGLGQVQAKLPGAAAGQAPSVVHGFE